MSISVKEEGNGYLVEVGDGQTIRLSPTDVITLAQLAQGLQLEILRKKDSASGTHLAVSAIPVVQARLEGDASQSAMLMTLWSPEQSMTYALLSPVVDDLAKGLALWVARKNSFVMTAH